MKDWKNLFYKRILERGEDYYEEGLFSGLEAVEVCPVVFEIFEGLKQEYGFRYWG